MKLLSCSLLALASLALVGCGSDDLTVYKVEKSTAEKKAPQEMMAQTADAGGHVHRPYDYDLPEGWSEKAAGGMRLASFDVKVDSAVLDASIVQLGPAAGDVLSNINRWRGQVGLPNATLEEIESQAITETSGLDKYRYWKLINADREDGGILAAMFHLPGAVLFVKVSGAPADVEKAESSFVVLCRSLRPHSH